MATTKESKKPASSTNALDLYKKLTLVRKAEDSVCYRDANTGSVVQITDLTNATSALLPPKPKLEIPVPDITAVDSYEDDVSATYSLPTCYVRNQRLSSKYDDSDFHYLADEVDEQFLLTCNNKISYTNITVTDLEKLIDILERATKFDAIVSSNTAERLFVNTALYTSNVIPYKQAVGTIYQHWVNKRCKLKKPLLRIYWPVTSPHDTNPHLVFRPREKEKYRLRKKRQNDLEGYKKLMQLKNDFEIVNDLIRTVQAREKIFHQQLLLRHELFEQKLYDCVDTSGLVNDSKVDSSLLKEVVTVPKFLNSPKRKWAGGAGDAGNDSMSHLLTTTGATGGADDSLLFAEGVTTPNFLHVNDKAPQYVTNWENEEEPWWNDCSLVWNDDEGDDCNRNSRFQERRSALHRRRVGRGGRIVIDRTIPGNEERKGGVLAWNDNSNDDDVIARTITLFPQPTLSSATEENPIGVGCRVKSIPDFAFFAQKSGRLADISLRPSFEVNGSINGNTEASAEGQVGNYAQKQLGYISSATQSRFSMIDEGNDALLVSVEQYVHECALQAKLQQTTSSTRGTSWGAELMSVGPL